MTRGLWFLILVGAWMSVIGLGCPSSDQANEENLPESDAEDVYYFDRRPRWPHRKYWSMEQLKQAVQDGEPLDAPSLSFPWDGYGDPQDFEILERIMPPLQVLGIHHREIPSSFWSYLPQHPLERLGFSYCKIAAVSPENLPDLPELRSLSFLNCDGFDESMDFSEIFSAFAEAYGSQIVALSVTRLTDDSLDDLAKFPNLRELDITGTRFSGDVIEVLEKMKGLERLWVFKGGPISERRLQKSGPSTPEGVPVITCDNDDMITSPG